MTNLNTLQLPVIQYFNYYFNINNKFHFKDHHNLVLSKAINQFNLLRRTCHFVKNPSKHQTLYVYDKKFV